MDFPIWMIESLDREASRLGVARQSLIKMLIARHLDRPQCFAEPDGREELPAMERDLIPYRSEDTLGC